MGSRLPGRGVNDSNAYPPPFSVTERRDPGSGLSQAPTFMCPPKAFAFLPVQTGSPRVMGGDLALLGPASETPSFVRHSPLYKPTFRSGGVTLQVPAAPGLAARPWPDTPRDVESRASDPHRQGCGQCFLGQRQGRLGSQCPWSAAGPRVLGSAKRGLMPGVPPPRRGLQWGSGVVLAWFWRHTLLSTCLCARPGPNFPHHRCEVMV